MFPEIWTVADRIFCHLDHFVPVYPPNNLKIKKKKMKNEKSTISLLYNGVPKTIVICYTVSDVWRIVDVTVIVHFGVSFTLLSL